MKRKIRNIFLKKKDGSVIENMLVALIGITMMMAFLVIIFRSFSSISARWNMRQAAREYLLVMESDGYLSLADQADLIAELESYGMYNVSLSGTTVREVNYGDRIYLKITGTYDDNILQFAGGISKVASNPVTITINRQTTAKQ